MSASKQTTTRAIRVNPRVWQTMVRRARAEGLSTAQFIGLHLARLAALPAEQTRVTKD